MAENSEKSSTESMMEKISDKFHGSGSSPSESESVNASSPPPSTKSRFNRLFGREKPVHKLLGGGKGTRSYQPVCFSVVTAIWVLFELMEYHLLTLMCHIMIAVLSLVFLWANVTVLINKSPPRIPEFQLKEDHFKQAIFASRNDLNRGLAVLHEIACGREVKKLIAVVAGLWVLSVAGSLCNFLTLFYITFVLLHTVPVLYEKYEDQVDAFADEALTQLKKQYSMFDAKVLTKIPRGSLKDRKKD